MRHTSQDAASTSQRLSIGRGP